MSEPRSEHVLPAPDRFTVLVCGSRTFSESPAIAAWLGYLNPENWRVIHGAAKGADRLAGVDASLKGYVVVEYPADWDRYGKRAGYVRNQQMLDEGKPDLVLAFVDKPLAESRGTAMMVDLARKAGIPTFVTEYLAPAHIGSGVVRSEPTESNRTLGGSDV